MNFSDALAALNIGVSIKRPHHHKGYSLLDRNIYLEDGQEVDYPWRYIDIVATDWLIVKSKAQIEKEYKKILFSYFLRYPVIISCYNSEVAEALKWLEE